MPRGTRTVDASSEYLGGDKTFDVAEMQTGDPANNIEVVDRVIGQDRLEEERFMNEPVTVMVHESTDDNADAIVPIWVNGRVQNFIRGNPQTVRRCYVERLARAKKTVFSQTLDERQGEAAFNAMRARYGLRFPFSVIEDKNPKGAAWLRGILAEPN